MKNVVRMSTWLVGTYGFSVLPVTIRTPTVPRSTIHIRLTPHFLSGMCSSSGLKPAEERCTGPVVPTNLLNCEVSLPISPSPSRTSSSSTSKCSVALGGIVSPPPAWIQRSPNGCVAQRDRSHAASAGISTPGPDSKRRPACLAVAKLRRHDQLAPSADAHPVHTLIPTRDHLLIAQSELQRVPSVPA